VTESVWSAQSTTPDAIDAALRSMLREIHGVNATLAPARVLNMVVIVDHAWKGEISNRLARVGRYHASRTVVCAVEDGRRTLDARAVMSYEGPGEQHGVMHEQVVMEIGPDHLRNLKTVIDPVLLSELPTLMWAPHGHDDAVGSVLDMIDVVLLDSDDLPEPFGGLRRAAELLESVYVVDLAWLRTTPWRERLAASFDPPARRPRLSEISALTVRHRPESAATGSLFAGWLASRLGWRAGPLYSTTGAELRGKSGDVEIALEPAGQDAPGLAGITVDCCEGFSLSLDRARGGLRARERAPSGEERVWHVLGASRGEGGILGEGVRQALLRDPTYGPALGAAREMLPA
jgi:glucose-6-phosphate dehydrogenase assembly protein OpcA